MYWSNRQSKKYNHAEGKCSIYRYINNQNFRKKSLKFLLNIAKQFYEQQNPNAPEGKTKKRKVKNLNSENKRQKI